MRRVGKEEGDNVKLVVGKGEIVTVARTEIGPLSQLFPRHIQHLVRRIDTRYTASFTPEEAKIIALLASHVEQPFAIRGFQEPLNKVLLAVLYVISCWRT